MQSDESQLTLVAVMLLLLIASPNRLWIICHTKKLPFGQQVSPKRQHTRISSWHFDSIVQ